MYSVLKKRKNFEELINDLQSFDSLVKYPSREASILKEWIDTITSNITDPSQISDEALKQILHDKAIQTSLIEMSDKATQTDRNEKGVQVNIIPELGKYTKLLHPYAGAEVVDHTGWFNKVRKQKATRHPMPGAMRIP